MRIPFVPFKPLEKKLDKELRGAFERVYTRSWYIEGEEDQVFEDAFAKYCGSNYCVGVGNGLDNYCRWCWSSYGARYPKTIH